VTKRFPKLDSGFPNRDHLTLVLPSWVEIVTGVGLYAFGAVILTALKMIAVTVRLEPPANERNRDTLRIASSSRLSVREEAPMRPCEVWNP